jgi:hypothetical protein
MILASIRTARAARQFLSVAALVFLFLAVATTQAQPYPWQVSSSIYKSSGDYGTEEDTDLLYVPVTVRRYLARGDVSVTVPYVEIDSSGGQTVIGGTVVEGEGGSGTGLGDVVLKGSYGAIQNYDHEFFLDVVGRLKLPTADESEGLGTGEADAGAGVELSKRIGTRYVGFGGASYTVIGDPPDTDYDNRVAYDVGLGYQFSPVLTCSVFYEVRTAVSEDSEDDHTVSFYANGRLSDSTRAFAGLDVGLTDGAADYGYSVGGSYRF